MGILADVFVATPFDALEYDSLMNEEQAQRQNFERFEVVEYKIFMGLDFEILWAIFLDEEFGRKHKLEHIWHSDDGRALERFPDSFVALLAKVGDQAIDDAAKAWGNTEELHSWVLAIDQKSPVEIRYRTWLVPAIHDFRRLARTAQATGKSMYLWNCV